MRVFHHFANLPADVRGAAAAIGNFDGVHLGHREVIGEAGRIARAGGRPWAVLTFEPHPRTIFAPDAPPFRLTPLPVKARLIAELGADVLVVVPFDREFSKLSPSAFVEQVIVGGLGASHLVCGHDFAFGHGRRGNPELLLWMSSEHDFGFTCVHEIRDANGDGEPYSSTRIRDALRRGETDVAARLLGRPFAIEGEVVPGEQRGRLLGYPTANIRLGDYVRPAFGIYAVRARLVDDEPDAWLPGAANLGIRPTFGGGEPLLEVYVFDFSGDLYGRMLEVQLVARLRLEKTFDDLEALRAQMADDCLAARRILGAAPPAAAIRAGSR